MRRTFPAYFRWIWYPEFEGEPNQENIDPDSPTDQYFRKTVDLRVEKTVAAAVFAAASDNVSTIYANGTEIGGSTRWQEINAFNMTPQAAGA